MVDCLFGTVDWMIFFHLSSIDFSYKTRPKLVKHVMFTMDQIANLLILQEKIKGAWTHALLKGTGSININNSLLGYHFGSGPTCKLPWIQQQLWTSLAVWDTFTTWANLCYNYASRFFSRFFKSMKLFVLCNHRFTESTFKTKMQNTKMLC